MRPQTPNLKGVSGMQTTRQGVPHPEAPPPRGGAAGTLTVR